MLKHHSYDDLIQKIAVYNQFMRGSLHQKVYSVKYLQISILQVNNYPNNVNFGSNLKCKTYVPIHMALQLHVNLVS